MNIKTFKTAARHLPPDIAILLRGPTGIGKSFLGKEVSDDLSLPFIDVRGSTMSEGDVGGYPDIESMKENGIMTFCMPSWFVRACKEPVVLMLDEVNRSLPGVQQSFFQLVLDRELGNDKHGVPYRLHPETRIIAAVNHGAEYDVNDMDPALLRRFWVVDLEPSIDDWMEWASENSIHSIMIDFVRNNPEHFRVDPSTVDPGTVVPCPASWHRLDTTLQAASLYDSRSRAAIYPLTLGFAGVEASIAFCDFVKNYEKVVTAVDVIDGWDGIKDIVSELSNDKLNGLIDKLSFHCKENEWDVTQASNVSSFAKTLSGELLVNMWNKISGSNNLPNIQKIHKMIGQKVVEIVNASRKTS
jgi:hypothetical protein